MHRPIVLSSLLALAALATGCATAPGSTVESATWNTQIAASAAVSTARITTGLSLRSDRDSYQAGSAIALHLHNDGASTYGLAIEEDSCATPTAVWLKNERGETFFVRSGANAACDNLNPIAAGSSAPLVTVDSDVVWIDRSSEESLYRLPRALPVGRYSVHALTPLGELVTSLEITPR